MINKSDSLGIPNYGIQYLEILPDQNKLQEIMKIHGFINSVCNSNTVPEFQGKEKRIQFINYGRTQLVYVLTIDENRQYTLLVNQPATKFGIGRREFENLQFLSKSNRENVVTPLYYFSDNNGASRELYVTPYHYQSRCIGVEYKDWGMWIPEPEYHFKSFTDVERQVINSSMVALLIKLYDDKRKRGLSECRLDGGDFMIEKGFEGEITFCNVLGKMKLIAARKLISMDFDKYVDSIRQELSGRVANESERVIVGKSIKSPMYMEEIERGIELGIELRNKRKENEVCL